MNQSHIFAVLDADLDQVVDWVNHHDSSWPLYGRLWAWTIHVGIDVDPERPQDRQAFVWLREAVAARIVTKALDRDGWSFEQLELDGFCNGEVAA